MDEITPEQKVRVREEKEKWLATRDARDYDDGSVVMVTSPTPSTAVPIFPPQQQQNLENMSSRDYYFDSYARLGIHEVRELPSLSAMHV